MQDNKYRRILIIATIVLLVALLLGWQLFFPLMLTAAAISAGVWGVLVGMIGLMSIFILLAFLMTSAIGFILLSAIGATLTIAAIVIAPFAFPILLPLLIVLLAVSLMRKKN